MVTEIDVLVFNLWYCYSSAMLTSSEGQGLCIDFKVWSNSLVFCCDSNVVRRIWFPFVVDNFAVILAEMTLVSALWKQVLEARQGPYHSIRWKIEGNCIRLIEVISTCISS